MRTKSKTNGDSSRPGGRPPKINKEEYGQITCVLRLDTIERLKAGAGSKHFGEYLQAHLDRFVPPTRVQYLAICAGINHRLLDKRTASRLLKKDTNARNRTREVATV
jgi:hypothetical protein